MWFHLGCLKPFPGEPEAEEILGADFFEVRPQIPEPFLRYLCIPIERGGLSGVAGNGKDQMWVRLEGKRSAFYDKKPDWYPGVSPDYFKEWEDTKLVYFYCPTCNRAI
jgi:hypothetical protein